ncbi:hypothetical protein Salat_2474800 [Sesamum alatum]|uniref:Uncharacterized protein n=1 Tax=Sesamum alatum TaxID=300844 RepID=A0AAE2CBW5_9LAMI|nr:hypothetical protein Salat_2474800 [Sesamum alatum]
MLSIVRYLEVLLVAEDVLSQIASRLKTRCPRDAYSRQEPAPIRPVAGFDPSGISQMHVWRYAGEVLIFSKMRYYMIETDVQLIKLESDLKLFHGHPLILMVQEQVQSVEYPLTDKCYCNLATFWQENFDGEQSVHNAKLVFTSLVKPTNVPRSPSTTISLPPSIFYSSSQWCKFSAWQDGASLAFFVRYIRHCFSFLC